MYTYWKHNEVHPWGQWALVYRPCGLTVLYGSASDCERYKEIFVDLVGDRPMPRSFQDTEPYHLKTLEKYHESRNDTQT